MHIYLLRYRECRSLINAYDTAKHAIDEAERRFDGRGWSATVQEDLRVARLMFDCPTYTNGLTVSIGVPSHDALEVVRLKVVS